MHHFVLVSGINDVRVNPVTCCLEFVSELETLLSLVFDQIGVFEEVCEVLFNRGSLGRNLIEIVFLNR